MGNLLRRNVERTAARTAPGSWTGHRHSGAHGSRHYDVYLPASLPSGKRVPLLLLLHGCHQNGVDFATASGCTAAADRDGFVVVVPRQEMRYQLQSCWRWYETAHQQRDGGEPAMLRDIVDEVVASGVGFGIDQRRIHVAGLSAGGAMALILATTYPDVFAAAGVHSATAYGSASQGFGALTVMAARGRAPATRSTGEMAPVIVIHGSADQLVRPPNGDRIVDQWLASREPKGLNRVRPLATTRALLIGGRRCTRTRWYSARGRRVLEYWRIDGLAHAWSGGTANGSFIDRSGPAATDLMWTFFERHRLSSAAVGPSDSDDFALDHQFGWPAPQW